MLQQFRTTLFAGILVAVAACNANESASTPEDSVRFVVLASASEQGIRESDACVRDLHTGLIWEQKVDAPGLRNWHNTYSWFNPTQSHREMDYRGSPDLGQCDGSDCDTWAYGAALNTVEYCGFSDWRLPSRDELFSISDLRKAKNPPTADMASFPYTQPDEYWSTHDYSFQPDSAWAWNFRYGHDRVDWKKAPKYVRLVRGEPSGLSAVKE